MTKYKSEFLNILDQRGFIHQCSDFDGLDKKLCEGVQSAYIGFDATAQSLHVGNLTGIMMLYWFQQCGHKPITLMGGGTSKIGDPSGKDMERSALDDSVIEENIKHIQETCFKQFLKYGDGPADALMVNNNDWLAELKYLDFLRDYGRHFTVNRMLTFDSVKTRLERESPLSLLEFNYMVMQGYDFVELRRRYGTLLQMGGSDQWGNIINGVDLWHKMHGGIRAVLAANLKEPIFALTAPLLTTPDGKKMGKTESGAVWLNAAMLPDHEYYQYWRNVDDAMVGTLLRRFTILPINEIEELEKLQGQEINEAKKILAREATRLCHGEKGAINGQRHAEMVFEHGGIGENMPSVNVDRNDVTTKKVIIVDLLVETGLAASKSAARKLIEQGGVKIFKDKVESVNQTLDIEYFAKYGHVKLSAGKKHHALVRIIEAETAAEPAQGPIISSYIMPGDKK